MARDVMVEIVRAIGMVTCTIGALGVVMYWSAGDGPKWGHPEEYPADLYCDPVDNDPFVWTLTGFEGRASRNPEHFKYGHTDESGSEGHAWIHEDQNCVWQ